MQSPLPLAFATPGLPVPSEDYIFTPVPIGQRFVLRTKGCLIGQFDHVETELYTVDGSRVSKHATTLPHDCEFDVVYANAAYWYSDVFRWRGIDLKPFTAEMR